MALSFVFLSLLIFCSFSHGAEEVPQSFSLDGRLFEAADPTQPLLDSGNIIIQVLDPAQSCVLYEETRPFNTTTTKGYFSLRVGTNTGATERSGADRNNSMATVFSNTATGIVGAQASDGTSACTYNPIASDHRRIRIKVIGGDLQTRVLSPDMFLDSVPTAVVAESAESLQGIPANQFLREGAGNLNQASLQNIFSTTNYANLTDLLNGGSSDYVQVDGNGAAIPNLTSTPSSPAAGQIWFDTTDNVIRYKDNTAVIKTLGVSGGSVTSVTAGTGLTGGTITGAGTIALEATGTAGTYTKVTTDAYGRVSSGASLVEADIPTLSAAGKVSGTAITSGQISGTTSISTTGAISTSGPVSARVFDVYDSDNTNFVRIQTPATNLLTDNYILTLPTDAGVAGQYLTTNGTGTLAWHSPPSCAANEKLQISAGPTIVWSCVTDSDSGGDILSVNTSTSSGLSGGVASGDANLQVEVDNTTIEIDPSNDLRVKDGGISAAKIAANAVTSAKINNLAVTDAKINDVSIGKITSAGLTDYFTYTPAGAACLAGQVLKWTASNRWECADDIDTNTNAVSSVMGRTGAVVAQSGDYTGSQVISVPAGNLVAVNIQAAINELDNEKVAKAGDVMTGNLEFNGQNGVRFADSDSGEYAMIRAPGVVDANYVLTLPANAGAAGELLTTDGNGNLTWTAVAGGDMMGVTTDNGSGLSGGAASGTAVLQVEVDNATVEINGSNDIQIKDLGVSTSKLAAGAVTNAKLADGSVSAAKLANGAIETAKIDDLAVTDAKISEVSVGKVSSAVGQYLTYQPNGAECTDGQVLKWTSNNRWECANDIDTNTDAITSIFGRTGVVVSQAGDYTASQITNNPSGGVAATTVQAAINELDSEKVSKAGDTMSGNLVFNAQNGVRFADGDSGEYAMIRAPNVIGTNYVLTLPDTAGAAGELLTTDGAGNLSWVAATGGDITGVTTNNGSGLSGGAASGTPVLQVEVDDVSIEINGSNNLQVKDLGIGSAKIAGSAVTTGKIADGNVTTAKIADSNVTTAKIADGAVTDAKINTVSVSKIVDGFGQFFNYQPDGSACGVGQVLKWQLMPVPGWVCGDDSDAVAVTNVATGSGLTGGPITTTGTISIANDGVTSTHIADGTIAAVDIASDAVTTAKILDANVTTAKIADAGVTTAKIADSNVTTAKIANSAVTNAKIVSMDVSKLDSGVGLYFDYMPNNAACGNNQVLKWDNTNSRWVCGADDVGVAGVTNVATGSGLSGGPITSTGTISIATDGVTSTHIADGTIAAVDIASNAVTTAKILDANVTTAKIADAGVTTAKIADGNVTSAKIADANVTTAKIADSNVTTAKIADGNVTTAKIADSNVTTAKIANGAVTDAKINTVSVSKIVDGFGQYLNYQPNGSPCGIGQVLKWQLLPVPGWVCGDDSDAAAVTNVATGSGLTGGPITSTGTISIANDGVTSTHIADGTIAAVDIASNAVTTAKILDANVTTSKIADSNVTTAKIANSAVTNSKIASMDINKLDSGVGLYFDYMPNNAACGNNQVLKWDNTNSRWICGDDSDAVAVTNVSTGSGLTGGPITTTGTISIATDGVTSAHIADGTIAAVDIASNAVTTAKILDANVTTAKIADSNVTTAKIADGAVTNAKIATVGVSKVANGAGEYFIYRPNNAACADGQVLKWDNTNSRWGCGTDDAGVSGVTNVATGSGLSGGPITSTGTISIATGGVTSTHILDGTIAAADIASNAVTTVKILDANVTTAKIADGNVTTAKIADGNVTTAKIADANVTTAKIADSNVTTAKILDANVTTAKIADSNVTTAKIANGAVTDAKINTVSVSKIVDGFGQYLNYQPNGSACGIGQVLKWQLLPVPGWICGDDSDAAAVTNVATGSGLTGGPITSTGTISIATGGVTSSHIADGTIAAADLASNAVTTVKILDANVTTAKIADANVTTAKIADANVTTAKIADGAVTNAKIATVGVSKVANGAGEYFVYRPNNTACTDGQVLKWDNTNSRWGCGVDDAGVSGVTNVATGSGLSGGPITSTGTISIATGGVTSTHILDGTIAAADIASNAVTTVKILDGNVTTAKIADANITTAKIADSNVTTAKIANGAVTDAKIATMNVTKLASGVGSYLGYEPNGAACGVGQVLKWQLLPVPGWICGDDSDAAAVTNVATGSGLTGGPITSTGTISIATGGVTSTHILNGTIAAADLGSNAVTTVKILDANVTTAKIADANVTTAKIADGAVTSAKIASLDVSKVANGAGSYLVYRPNNTACTDGQVLKWDNTNSRWICGADDAGVSGVTNVATGSGLSGGPITSTGTISIATGGVTSTHILDGTIAAGDIASNAVTTAKILDANVTTAKVADGAITDAKIASVGVSKVANGAGEYFIYRPNNVACTNNQVLKWDATNLRWACGSDDDLQGVTNVATGSGLTGGPITSTGTIAIATGGVTSTHILDGTIAAADLASNAVSTVKILDANVTTAKIADANVTTAKLANGAVTDAKINTVSVGKITDGLGQYLNYQPNGSACGIGQVLKWQLLPAPGWICGDDSDAAAVTNVATGSGLTGGPITSTGTISIATGGVTSTHILNGTIAAADLASNAVTTVKILDANVTTAKIADANVTTAKIADGAVTSAKIASLDVSKVANGAGSYFLYRPNNTACTDGQVLKWDNTNSRWACGADTAGSGTLTNVATGSGLTGGPITTTGTISIATGGVTTTHILDGTIAAADIASNAVTTVKILDGNVTTAKIADSNVTTAKIANGAVTDAKIATMNVSKVASGVGSYLSYAPNGADCAVGEVLKWQLLPVPGWVCASDTAGSGTVTNVATGSGLTGGPITGTGTISIATGGVTTTHILNGTIAAADLASNAVTTVKILDANVTTAKIADSNVTTAKIANGAVTDAKIATVAVNKVANGVGAYLDYRPNNAACTNNQVLKWDATNFRWICGTDDNVTGVTNVATGSGLTGGPITTTGTIAIATGGVTTTHILDGTIAAADLASNAVTTVKILNGNVTTAKIADANVTTAKILDANVTTAKIANGAVTDAKIGTMNVSKVASGVGSYLSYAPNNVECGVGQVLKWQLLPVPGWICGDDSDAAAVTNVATGSGLTGGPITSTGTIAIASGGVTSTHILNGTIAAADLASNAVTTVKILDANVTTAKIADSNITTAKIANGAVTDAKIGTVSVNKVANAVGAYLDYRPNNAACTNNQVLKWDATNFRWICATDTAGTGTVTSVATGSGLTGGPITSTGTIAIATDGVTSAHIANGTIAAGDLGSNAVTTVKILDANVTTAKIADANVTTAKIADANVTTAKIANGAITDAKIATVAVNKVANAVGAYLDYRPNNAACTVNQVLKWDATNFRWICSNDLGATDHGALTGLADDDHTQYVMGAGRAGGQTINGGTAASQSLVLESTAHATKGYVILQPGNGNVGIGNSVPAHKLDVTGNVNLSGSIGAKDATPSASIAINSAMTIGANANRQGINSVVTLDDTQALTAARSTYGNFSDVISNLTETNRAGFGLNIFGSYNRARASATAGTEGAATTMYGTYNYALEQSSSATAMTAMYGSANLSAKNGAGSVTNNYGVSITTSQNNAASTTTNAHGVRSTITNTAGTMTNAFQFYGSYSGTIGTKWGIYLSGEDKSYFNGDVGIGTATPAQKLDVAGNVRATAFISTSDRRLKKNIATVPGLEGINRLRGVRWTWRESGEDEMGIIAQEVEEVYPELVITDPNTGYKSVKYSGLIAPLIEATKSIDNQCKMTKQDLTAIQRRVASVEEEGRSTQKKIQSLETENKVLRKQLQSVEDRLKALEERLNNK